MYLTSSKSSAKQMDVSDFAHHLAVSQDVAAGWQSIDSVVKASQAGSLCGVHTSKIHTWTDAGSRWLYAWQVE